jgi:predicted AAA+ superfamily ATPase
MVARDSYIRKIERFMNKPLVKVLTGIRRCGKSSILLLLAGELLKKGIKPANIISINFEDGQYLDMDSAKETYTLIKSKMTGRGKHYILLDEIQIAPNWERAVNSLLLDGKADIYITGSNSKLLSSELATYIAGRYVEINVKPLSFAEYLRFRQAYTTGNLGSRAAELKNYIRTGGFPIAHIAEYGSQEEIYKIINDIYSSAILRDAVQRHKIRNVEILERVVRFVFDNTGNTFSAKKVADYFKNQQRKIELETVYNYLNALEDAFIIKRIPRYDIKGKEILKTQEKYYVGDHSLIYAVMGYKDSLISGVLENIVLHELERRGYRVFVGKLDTKEIDFIAERKNEKIYVQVTYQMGSSKETIEREFSPLLRVKDHYPKYVVSLDDFWQDNIEGVRYKPLAEFLLSDEY